MKKIILTLALALGACDIREVNVLSSDGTKVVAVCYTTGEWAKCLADACPNGLVVVMTSTQDETVKCK